MVTNFVHSFADSSTKNEICDHKANNLPPQMTVLNNLSEPSLTLKSLFYFLIWRVTAAKSENIKGFSMSEKAQIKLSLTNFC